MKLRDLARKSFLAAACECWAGDPSVLAKYSEGGKVAADSAGNGDDAAANGVMSEKVHALHEREGLVPLDVEDILQIYAAPIPAPETPSATAGTTSGDV